MSWTCTRCKTSFEEQDDINVQFCPVCGAPVHVDHTHGRDDEMLDNRLRLVMLGFGILWLVLFFIPFGTRSDYSPVWSWELLRNTEDMAYMVAWPLVVGMLFLVLGLASPLPRWLRHGGGLLLSLLTLGVLFGSESGGPFSPELSFLFSGGVCWILMFFMVGTSLVLLVKYPDLLGVKLFLGLGLVLGVIAYLSPDMGESTMVSALLYRLGVGDAAHTMARVLLLLPMFALLMACVGFGSSSGNSSTVSRWSKVLGLGFLIYAPALMVLFGLLVSSAQDSIWYLLIFVKLAIYAGGLFFVGNISSRWLVHSAVAMGHPGFSSDTTVTNGKALSS